MSFFGKILEKLGLGDDKKATPSAGAPAATGASATTTAAGPGTVAGAGTAPGAAATAGATAAPMSTVDVVAQLEQRAASNPQKLNWRTSIVDLLKLLDMDSSLQARKELAQELGCPSDLMGDSARMNMWLHKKVLERIAANGGNVPKELLD